MENYSCHFQDLKVISIYAQVNMAGVENNGYNYHFYCLAKILSPRMSWSAVCFVYKDEFISVRLTNSQTE